jgi:hypothetical protein
VTRVDKVGGKVVVQVMEVVEVTTVEDVDMDNVEADLVEVMGDALRHWMTGYLYQTTC